MFVHGERDEYLDDEEDEDEYPIEPDEDEDDDLGDDDEGDEEPDGDDEDPEDGDDEEPDGDEEDEDDDKDDEKSLEDLKKELAKKNAMLKRARKKLAKQGKQPDRTERPVKKPVNRKEEAEANQFRYERSEFRQDHPELKRLEVDEIETYARAKKVSMEKALKSPMIKSWLKRLAKKRKLADSQSAASRSRGGSTTTKGKKDWENMSNAEFGKHLEKQSS